MNKYIYLIMLIIFNNQINQILSKLNEELSNCTYHNNFKVFCKEILYSPELSSYIFSDPNLYLSSNFENINLDRYWVDYITYSVNKNSSNLLIEKIKNNNMIKTDPQINDLNILQNIFITKNDYPYIVPNLNYNSYVIWNLSNSNFNFSQALKYFNLNKKDWIIWKNNPVYKSVKFIDHYHLIVRNSIPKLKLKKILILQRHGPREPLDIPAKFSKSYWTTVHTDIDQAIQGANLTLKGKLYSQYMGSILLDNYKNYFDFASLNKSDILFASSNFQRTIETSILTLNGLELNKLDLDLNILDFLSSDTIFTPEQKQSYNKKLKDFFIDFEYNLDDFNKEIFELTGFEIKTFRDYFELASTIKCYEFNEYPMLSDPIANEKLNQMKNTIYNLATYYYNLVNSPNNDNLKECELLGKTVVDNILKLFVDPKYKFILLTSHDNLLMPTIKYLVYGILNNQISFINMNWNQNYFNLKNNQDILAKINFLKFPDFNISIRLELWDNIYGNSKIRIYYGSLLLFEFDN